MNVLKIKKLKENAIIPKRATEGSAGMDLYACIDSSVVINPGDLVSIHIARTIQISIDHCMANNYGRSGFGIKHGICLSNGVGVVDSDYRGEVCVGLCNVSNKPYTIEPNERIAQMVIAPVSLMNVEEVSSLEDTVRGEGGFGSTGKK